MHVLILNQTFWPDTAATAQLMWDLARHLDAEGHRVTVVTSRYRYGTTERIGPARERIGNIEVRRTRGGGRGKGSLLKRVIDQASFFLFAAVELARVEAPDVILALTSPPMISTLAALQRTFRTTRDGRPVRFVYHVMDLYPDAAIATGMQWAERDVERVFGRLTRLTLNAADAVIVLGRDMRDRILTRYGDDQLARRMHVVPPWADGWELMPRDKGATDLARELDLNGTFTIAYSGNFGYAHDMATLVSAMELMRDDAETAWLFIGSGRRYDELRQRVESLRLSNVRFLPPQPREDLDDALNAADVHLVSLLSSFTGIVVPSKLFGIMAVGRPTVLVGPAESEVGRIVEERQIGYVVPNGDPPGLVERLRALRDDPALRQQMGAMARETLVREYDRRIACEKIQAILENVVM